MYVPPPFVLSDEVSQGESTETNAPSAVVSTSDTSSYAKSAKPVCNFVFPKFQIGDENDPVDDLLQSIQASSTTAAGESPDRLILKDWELQDAILGQYLVFDEDSTMEAV